MAIRSANINIMVRAAENAGKTLIRDFNEIEQLQLSKKSPILFMKKAKEHATNLIQEELEGKRPDFTIASLPQDPSIIDESENLFLFDALEGEENYAHGLPYWCIAIHFIKMGNTKASIIFDPINHELFWTQYGQGAFVNRHKLYISKRDKFKGSILSTKLPAYTEPHQQSYMKQLNYLSSKEMTFRDFGCQSLNMVYAAAGRFDGYFGAELDFHQTNATELFMTEAGGKAGYYWPNGDKSQRGFIGANEKLFFTLQKVILNSYPSK